MRKVALFFGSYKPVEPYIIYRADSDTEAGGMMVVQLETETQNILYVYCVEEQKVFRRYDKTEAELRAWLTKQSASQETVEIELLLEPQVPLNYEAVAFHWNRWLTTHKDPEKRNSSIDHLFRTAFALGLLEYKARERWVYGLDIYGPEERRVAEKVAVAMGATLAKDEFKVF